MRFDPETMKVKLCKKCKGLGYGIDLKGNKFRCSECSGTGRVVENTLKDEYLMDELSDAASFDKETMKVVICKTCAGLGVIVFQNGEESECRECNGHGRYIERKIMAEYQMHHFDGFTEKEEQ